jgi:hypothetical protein
MYGWSMFKDARPDIEDLTVRSEKISRQLYAWIESSGGPGFAVSAI